MAGVRPWGGCHPVLLPGAGLTGVNREEFCTRVERCLRRATAAERESIGAEIAAHLEDHASALEEAGYGPAEAEVRAVEAMGEPEKIGKALNEQMSGFWLALHNVSTVAIVLGWLLLCNTLPGIYFFGGNLCARWNPEGSPDASRSHEGYEMQPVDLRVRVKSDVLRVYQVGLDQFEHQAEVVVCVYDQSPFGRVDTGIIHSLRFQAPDGSWERYGGGSGGNDGAWYGQTSGIPVEPGQKFVTMGYDRYGEKFTLEIPLKWEAEE